MEFAVDCILCLFIYSFLGWCCETVSCSFSDGKFVNRGFLNGPFCPIYGFGALAVIGVLYRLPDHVFSVFFGGMLITSALEYFTSWLMEKLFDAKWWDYSTYPFNLNGRVCLRNSVLFGLLCLLLKFDVHPIIKHVLGACSFDFKMGFTLALLIYFAVDMTITVRSVLGLNKRVSRIWKIRGELLEAKQSINEHLESNERMQELKEKINEYNAVHRRLLKAFPHYSSLKSNEAIAEIKKSIEERGAVRKEQKARQKFEKSQRRK